MKMVPRRTKILATLGPATESEAAIDGIIKAGVDIVRLNFSHGDHEDHIKRANLVKELAARNHRSVGILVDLQGPKIRVQRFVDGKIDLQEGADFCLDLDCPVDEGSLTRVGITYPELIDDVKVHDQLVLDDGRIILRVLDVEPRRVLCKVEVGGELSNNKGINLKGGGLSAHALTAKDKKDILAAAEINCDYLAVSFPKRGRDMDEARELLLQAGCRGALVAKVERAEAIENIDSIIDSSDAIMIARGDLGVEIGDDKLPGMQKRLISLCRDKNRVVITATQMMESMRENPIPTRAEVFDVANAVLDGTDAVMLSAETATGKFPVKTVKAMANICKNAEMEAQALRSSHRMNSTFEKVDEAVAMAAMYTANHLKVRAIASLTESGNTSLWMSRISSGIPIYALTRHAKTLRKVTMYRGVNPVFFPTVHNDHAKANVDAINVLMQAGAVEEGDLVIITKGDLMGTGGGTNAMKIVKVGAMPEIVE